MKIPDFVLSLPCQTHEYFVHLFCTKYERDMKSVKISDFRQEIAYYLDKVKKGESLVLTNHGNKIALISPTQDSQSTAVEQLKQIRESARVGDVTSPIGVDWKVQ